MVEFVSVATGQIVAGSSAAVNMAGCTAGQFVYTNLPASITLQAGSSYYLASQEVAGLDTWYNNGGVSVTSAATVPEAVYYGGIWYPTAGANTSYGPPNFKYSGGSGTTGGGPFVTGYAGSTARNDYSGWVGMQLTVGSSSLTVTAVGRLCLAGNSAHHMVEFASFSTGLAVTGGSASVNMAGCTPGQFVYANLPAAITLPAGTMYYLASQEVAGGDTWYGSAGVTTTSDAAVTNSAFYGAIWYPSAGANTSYGPPNFEYSIAGSSSISVTVGTNISGASFVVDGTTYNSTQVLQWSSGSSHTLSVVSPQSGGTGTQYVWSSWSDAGAISHTVSPTTASTFTANFTTQYLLTLSVAAGSGSITAVPSSSTGYYNSGTPVQLTAWPGSGSTFVNWGGSISGGVNPQTLTITAPSAVSAYFQATVQTWSITGSVGAAGSGATIALSGTSTATTTANGSGSYTFTGLANGSYTVTPSLTGYTFSPTSVAVTVSGANATAATMTATANGSATPFVTAFAGSTVRNDYSGWVGMQVTVGSSPLNVTSVGRLCLAGNATSHMVEFVSVATGQIVAGSSAAVNMAGCTAGQFVYTNLPASITLQAGSSYYLASQEVAGLDTWYNNGGVSVTSAATVPEAVYYGGIWYPTAGANTSYGPPNFQYTGGSGTTGGTPFVTAFAGSTVRNDYSGWLGMQLTVGSSSLNVTSVGRLCLAGNSASHMVEFFSAATGLAVAGGSAAVNMAGCTAGQFVYANLPTGITLQAGTSYYVASQEVAGGDTWYSNGGVSVTSAATVPNAAYLGGIWYTAPGANTSYVPPNFKYSGGSGTAFVTAFAGSTVRNDYGGWLGMELTVGSSSLTVTSVGRLCLAGNSASHTVEFVSTATGQAVTGGSASVNMAGCTAGQFVYVSLPAAITLQAGSSYYLASQEVVGGDTWYSNGGVDRYLGRDGARRYLLRRDLVPRRAV